VTNAVKHFKWEPRGKQRLHRSPKPNEIVACRPWLEAEIEAISPSTIVALGAVAAKSFFGPAFRLHKARGLLFETQWCERMLVTHHPAAILRAADRTVQRGMRAELEADLALALREA
jgi:DNA polymerase